MKNFKRTSLIVLLVIIAMFSLASCVDDTENIIENEKFKTQNIEKSEVGDDENDPRQEGDN